MSSPFPLGFSTLGSPQATFPEACALARAHGLGFVELRSLAGTTDLPAHFRQHPPGTFAPEVRVLGTSLSLLSAKPADLDAFYAMAALAHDTLRVPYLRVFGEAGAPFGPELSTAQLAAAAATVRTVRERLAREGWRVEVLLEAHDVFSSADRCLALNAYLDEPLALLWDSHHTWRETGEPLAETWRKIGPRVRHIHYKDSVPGPDGGVHHTLPGEGAFPGEALRELLVEVGYRGGLSLEWERLWHPELPPLEEALPLFLGIFNHAA